jgi:DNA-binding NarL/FixJ family response regulator
VVDDHSIVREAMNNRLRAIDGVEVVGEGASGEDAVDLVRRLRPDVLVVDWQTQGMSGYEATQVLSGEGLVGPGKTRVIACTGHPTPSLAKAFAAAGATGFVSKDLDPESIARAVLGVARGENWWGYDVTSGNSEFTPRELDVLALMVEGMSNKEIASALCIALGTVKKHSGLAYEKLGVTSDREAISKAFELQEVQNHRMVLMEQVRARREG